MSVAFIYDRANADGTRGGAEYAMAGFAEGHELAGLDEADTVVVGNCVTVGPSIIKDLEGKKVWRFHHDLARREDPELRVWLNQHAEHIFTSPLHVKRYRWHDEYHLIPPIADLAAFRPNRQTRRHPDRKGTVTVGAWQNPGKGGRMLSGMELDCYGTGQFAPNGPGVRYMGEADRSDLPAILQRFERFAFLPVAVEPFGRCVAEAWASGCELLVNGNVGVKWWIENQPDDLYTSAEQFWELVSGD